MQNKPLKGRIKLTDTVAFLTVTIIIISLAGYYMISSPQSGSSQIDTSQADNNQAGNDRLKFNSTFETGSYFSEGWDGYFGTGGESQIISTLNPHEGSCSARFRTDKTHDIERHSNTEYSAFYKDVSQLTSVYVRVYAYFENCLGTEIGDRFYPIWICDSNNPLYDFVSIVGVRNFAEGNRWIVMTKNNGTNANYIVTNSTTVVNNRWYCLELYVSISATNGTSCLWIDGVQYVNAQGLDTDNFGNIDRVYVGIMNSSWNVKTPKLDVYIDDVIVSDSPIG